MSCLLCIPLRASTFSELLEKIQKASAKADVLELWLDEIALEETNWSTLFGMKTTQFLLNVKSAKEGGGFAGTNEEKLEILLSGAKHGAEYCDLDYEFPPKLIKKFIQDKGATKLILSAHFFTNTPEFSALQEIAKTMIKKGADMVKIATMANSERDVATIMKLSQFLKSQNIPFITIAMGKIGQPSRLITPKLGSAIMFAALEDGAETAAGQMTVDQLRVSMVNEQ